MINLSELVREEGSLGLFGSLKSACSSDVYLAEDVGDFLVNRGRIYIPPYKFNSMFEYNYYYVKFNDVFLGKLEDGGKVIDDWWKVYDKNGQFLSRLNIDGGCKREGYTFQRASFEQGFESGDFLHSLTLKYFQKVDLSVIIDLQKDSNFKLLEENSVLDRIKDKFEELVLRDPVPEPS